MYNKIIRVKLRFWQQWLLHAFVMWFGLTLFDMLSYLYRVQTWGSYILHADGTPVSAWQRFAAHNVDQRIWLDILVYVFFAEANYHFVFRRRPFKLFLGSSLLGSLVCMLYLISGHGWRSTLPVDPVASGQMALYFAAYNFGYSLLRDFLFRQAQAAESRLQHSQAELQALKAQVNPHFFFNTLNSLYGTALQENASRTAESIEKLSGMMRYTMTEAQREVIPVAHEIKFLEDYLQLQAIRIPAQENIAIRTRMHHDGQFCQVTPLLLIPFMENAFKYGISIDHSCFIHIDLDVTDRQLHLVIQNTMLSTNPASGRQSTGIDNTRKRLQLLYPGKHQLTIHQNETFQVELKLDLR